MMIIFQYTNSLFCMGNDNNNRIYIQINSQDLLNLPLSELQHLLNVEQDNLNNIIKKLQAAEQHNTLALRGSNLLLILNIYQFYQQLKTQLLHNKKIINNNINTISHAINKHVCNK